MKHLPLLAIVLLAACGGGPGDDGPDGMRQASLPDGFVISHPGDWTVTAEPGRTELRSAGGDQFVLVQAVFGGGRADGRALLDALARQGRLGPLEQPQIVAARGSATDVEALLSGRADGRPMRGQALVAVRGGAATVYVVGAADEDFADAAPRLLAILKSFGRGGAAAPAPAASGLRYRRVEDANERAYSLELPDGWNVDVAMHRMGTDLRPEASARSPEGDILLFFNDRNVGPFAVPTPTLMQFGLGEGATYNPAGRPMLVWRYLPGTEFLKWWLPQRFNGARITGEGAQPDVAQQIGAARYQYGNPMGATVHSGEITFEHQGRRGRVHATTEIYGYGDTRNWSVIYHHGYLADAAAEARAAEAVRHAVATTQINLQWLQRERRMQAVDAENQLKAMQAINDIWRGTMAERSASSDARARVQGDLLSGTFRVVDPTTGETGTVQAGSNYYYRVPGTGGVVGTNVDQGHPVDLTRLIRLDWDRE